MHHVEAVVEVFAERPRLHQRHEVLVRCRDDADVDFDFLAAAHALETALLKHAEQFDLQFGGQLAHFVEEQRAPAGLLKTGPGAWRPRR